MSYKNKWSPRVTANSVSKSSVSRPRGSSVETPSYATSWNSIRWSRSLVDHGQSAKLASAFESTSQNPYSLYNISSTSPRFSSLPSRRKLPDISSSGPSVAERRTVFGEKAQPHTVFTSSLQSRATRGSYLPNSILRSSALNQTYFPLYSTRKFSTTASSRSLVDRTRKKPFTRIASWEPPSKTTDTYSRRPLSVFPTPTATPSTPEHKTISFTPKAERPWRQRLWDAARLRSLHGDQVGTAVSTSVAAQRSRRSSITNSNSPANRKSEELQTSLNALKQIVGNTSTNSRYRYGRNMSAETPRSYVESLSFPATTLKYPSLAKYNSLYGDNAKKRQLYMSRSYSPVSSRKSILPVTNSIRSLTREEPFLKLPRHPSKESIYDNNHPDQSMKLSQTNVQERSHSPKCKISKDEKKARRKSKQRNLVQQKSTDSSSGAEERAESREKRLQKKRTKKKSTPAKVEGKDGLDEKPSSKNDAEALLEQNEDVTSHWTINESKKSPTSSSSISSLSPDIIIDETHNVKMQTLEDQRVLKPKIKSDRKFEPQVTDSLEMALKPEPTPVTKPRVFLKQSPPRSKIDEKVVESNSDNDEFHSLSDGESNQGLDGSSAPIFPEYTQKDDEKSKSNMVISIPINYDGCYYKDAESEVPLPLRPLSPLAESLKETENLQLNTKSERKANGRKNSNHQREDHPRPQLERQLPNLKKVPPKVPIKRRHLTEIERTRSQERHVDGKKPGAPVPGTWIGPTHELNISHNKRFERNQPLSLENVTVIKPYKDVSRVEPFKVLLERKKKSLKEILLDIMLQMKPVTEETTLINHMKRFTTVTEVLIVKRRKPVTVNTASSFRKPSKNVKITSVVVIRSKIKECCSLLTTEPSTVVITLKKDITNNKSGERMSSDAQLILRPTSLYGRNYYRCKRGMRANSMKRQSLPSLSALIDQQTAIIEAEKDRLTEAALSIGKEDQPNVLTKRSNESVASVVLDYLRCCDEVPLRRGSAVFEEILRSEKLILPNRSVLEDFIRQRRKARLERLHSEPPPAETEESRADSPCLSTASELIPACAVRILEPTRNISYITVPSRNRLSSVETNPASRLDSTVAVNNRMNMFDRLAQAENALTASYHGLAVPFAQNKQRSLPAVRPTFKFDSPNSPFEAKVQHQAKLLRNSSVSSDISTVSEGNSIHQSTPTFDAPMQLTVNGRHRRTSADGGTPITCNFEAAAAAASKPRHERYAAHIPVKRDDNDDTKLNERMAANLNETWEGATKKSGEMIDQARFRHNQQRSKFKDAIDYLDQIFEDLKKECDSPQPNSKSLRRMQSITIPTKPVLIAKPVGPYVSMPSQNRVYPVPEIKNRYSNPALDGHLPKVPPIHARQSSSPLVKPYKAKKLQKGDREKVGLSEQFHGDVEVSETIVLPSGQRKLKGEKLDFTQKWLEGDLKSWVAAPPKADINLDGMNEEDSFDERSLGSCSAEVAAINSVVRKKKKSRDASNAPKVIETIKPNRKVNGFSNGDHPEIPGLLKPQAVRPQPIYGFPTASSFTSTDSIGASNRNNGISASGSNSNLNNFPQLFRDIETRSREQDQFNNNHYPLKRVSSHNQVIDRKLNEPSWRSKQDAYNTIGSVKSEDIAMGRPNGAFVQYSPNNIADKKPSPISNSAAVKLRLGPQQDAVLTIDALVAELELNTDQTAVNLKRRSFPTKFESSANRALDHGHSISSRQLTNGKVAAKSRSNGATKPIGKLKGASFDEMATMIHNVASEVSSLECRTRKTNQINNFNGSVLSPFETINQERLEPSKVEAIQSMFESRANSSPQRSFQQNLNVGKEDDVLYEFGSFSKLSKQRSPSYPKLATKSQSPSNASIRSQKIRKSSPLVSHHELTPPFPATQLTVCPPGSTNSSQTGGYYSSGSSLGASSSHASQRQPSVSRKIVRQGSVVGNQSLSSQAISIDDEDDGFYDNIQIDEKRMSRVTDVDNASVSSHLPPTARGTTRLAQFLRKIGASKPPGSAASLMSLNKVASDKVVNLGSLTKSNSFSNEPWKEQIINANGSAKHTSKKMGIGQMIKNSLFGSRKKLN